MTTAYLNDSERRKLRVTALFRRTSNILSYVGFVTNSFEKKSQQSEEGQGRRKKEAVNLRSRK